MKSSTACVPTRSCGTWPTSPRSRICVKPSMHRRSSKMATASSQKASFQGPSPDFWKGIHTMKTDLTLLPIRNEQDSYAESIPFVRSAKVLLQELTPPIHWDHTTDV